MRWANLRVRLHNANKQAGDHFVSSKINSGIRYQSMCVKIVERLARGVGSMVPQNSDRFEPLEVVAQNQDVSVENASRDCWGVRYLVLIQGLPVRLHLCVSRRHKFHR